MACLLIRRNCKVCGEPHNLFLRGEELNTEERYEYECPVTGMQEFLWEIKRVESVPEPPADAIEIHSTHAASERT